MTHSELKQHLIPLVFCIMSARSKWIKMSILNLINLLVLSSWSASAADWAAQQSGRGSRGRLRTHAGSTKDHSLASPKCLSVPCNVLVVSPHSRHTHHSPVALQSLPNVFVFFPPKLPNARKKQALVNSWLDDELDLKWHSAHRAGLTHITEQKVWLDVRVNTHSHTTGHKSLHQSAEVWLITVQTLIVWLGSWLTPLCVSVCCVSVCVCVFSLSRGAKRSWGRRPPCWQPSRCPWRSSSTCAALTVSVVGAGSGADPCGPLCLNIISCDNATRLSKGAYNQTKHKKTNL